MAIRTDVMILGAVVVVVIIGAVAIAFITPQGQQMIGAAGGGLIASILGFFTGIWNGIAGWFSGLFKALNPANWHLQVLYLELSDRLLSLLGIYAKTPMA